MPTFSESLLATTPPERLAGLPRPDGSAAFPSPADWREEVLYFLLPDRFSDGREDARPLVNRGNRSAARPASSGTAWRWDHWDESGGDRWQGGTLAGIRSKLDYLRGLGVTTLWIGPVFKQRGSLDSFHGYAIQDFLDVDPHFGTRGDLVDLVADAHRRGLRIILDVIFNHSGPNFDYQIDGRREVEPGYRGWPGFYPDFTWRGANDQSVTAIAGREDGVWPRELQHPECYTRAGKGDLGAGGLDDPHAEHKRSDFLSLRDFNFDPPGTAGASDPRTLSALAQCYKYWIALADCDGFRIDTLKHVSFEDARNFCGSIKEFAARIGKKDFFLVGEVAGGDYNQDRYLDVLGLNLNAALDIGEMRQTLGGVAKGLVHPGAYFDGFDPGKAVMGSHRNLGRHHVSILDDHDHVFGEKIRFSSDAASDHQVVAAVALQLFTLGIPCLYYGTEQALAGPEPSERHWLPDWKGSDRYLREAMFGPDHPRKKGRAGIGSLPGAADAALPGFGPFGTAGAHCFDPAFPTYTRVAQLTALRKRSPTLRVGRQYLRPTRFLGNPFAVHGRGELLAWSRVLDDVEAVCIINPHGTAARGADVLVDAALSPPGSELTVVANTTQAAGAGPVRSHAIGAKLTVQRSPDGKAFIEVRDVGPSECLVLMNHVPAKQTEA